MRMPCRLLAFFIFILFMIFFIQGAPAYQRCLLCGMDADRSETTFYLKMEGGRMYPLCSFQCVHMLMMNAKEKPLSIRTEDYPTSRLIDAEAAYYLCESRLVLKGSMVPYISAFVSNDKAEEYKKKFGGRILDFKGAMEIVKKAMVKEE